MSHELTSLRVPASQAAYVKLPLLEDVPLEDIQFILSRFIIVHT